MTNETLALSRFFNALGDETRLRLVALLAQQEPGNALCVSRLARELETTASNISQHLRVLKDLGLVYSERRSYNLHYFLNPEQLGSYRQLISELLGRQFLPNEPTITAIEEQKTMSENPDCTHPEKRPAEGDCSPEQIRECHGDVPEHPCECDCHGQDQPCDCSPEQIRECHGDVTEHPCENA
jgi:ArsR family transcriptional regulator, arsenate/arsenite/antimonite-responsive transcriptional repressor